MEKKNQYTSDELNQFEIWVDELIIWMFSNPNDRYTILQIIKKAYDFGKENEKT